MNQEEEIINKIKDKQIEIHRAYRDYKHYIGELDIKEKRESVEQHLKKYCELRTKQGETENDDHMINYCRIWIVALIKAEQEIKSERERENDKQEEAEKKEK